MTGRRGWVRGAGSVLLTDHAWPGTEVEAGLCDAAGILTADRDVRAGVWDPGRYAPT